MIFEKLLILCLHNTLDNPTNDLWEALDSVHTH